MHRVFAALSLAAMMLSGCGYTTRGNLPEHIKTVAVPIFKNRTTQGGIETAITSGVINAFSTRLKVVLVEQADAILDGEIVGYSATAVSFSLQATTTAYRVTYVFNIEFRDLRHNAVLWKEPALTATSDYTVQGSVSDSIAREVGATGQISDEISRRIINAATDRF